MTRPTILLALCFLAACAPLPRERVGTELPAQWLASPSFDERRPNFVILHQTSNDTAERALRTLTDPARQVSAHYLIGRDGVIRQLVDERLRAWHAGESWWGGLTDLNSASIGIELDNNGEEPFAEPQIAALLDLLADVMARHRIPAANVLGHGDIAPGRKVDPSRHFPWQRLAQRRLGLWCDEPVAPVPAGFDAALGLPALGYDVRTGEAAARAFRRHFVGDDSTADLSGAELVLLYCLVRRKAGD